VRLRAVSGGSIRRNPAGSRTVVDRAPKEIHGSGEVSDIAPSWGLRDGV
jgi:hypothetical protein